MDDENARNGEIASQFQSTVSLLLSSVDTYNTRYAKVLLLLYFYQWMNELCGQKVKKICLVTKELHLLKLVTKISFLFLWKGVKE